MADIVKSSSFEGRGNSLMSSFKKTVMFVNKERSADIASPLTITLGDEFQGIAKNLPSAIRLLVAIEEARVKIGVDFYLRYVICQGKVETAINNKIAHEMLGSGLTRAREQINSMKSDKYSSFGIELLDKDFETLLNNALILYFGIMKKWKPSDYSLIAAFLDGNEYKAAAEILGRERTSTLRKYRSLRMDEYFAGRSLLFTLSERDA